MLSIWKFDQRIFEQVMKVIQLILLSKIGLEIFHVLEF